MPHEVHTRARAAPAGSSTTLLAAEVVTLALSPADRRRLVAWLDETLPPEGRLATVLHSVAAQLRPTLPKATPRALDTVPS